MIQTPEPSSGAEQRILASHRIALLGAVALAILTWIWHYALLEPGRVHTDIGQHASVARQILAGNGYVTDNLAYEEQFAFGTRPAPQTVWPPGHAYVIAAATLLTGDAVRAAQLVGISALALQVVTTFLLLHLAGLRPIWGLAGSAGVALLAAPMCNGMMGSTEPLFVLLTLVSACCFLASMRKPSRHSVWLLAAGIAAAAACLFRYAGIVWIIALTIAVFLDVGLRPIRHVVLDALRTSLPGALVLAAVSARNALLTGVWKSDLLIDMGSDPLRVAIDLVREFMLMIRGYPPSAPLAVVSDILLVGFALIFTWLLYERLTRMVEMRGRDPVVRLLAVVLLYCAGTIAMVGWIAIRTSEDFVDFRYLLPLFPFVVAAAVALLGWASVQSSSRADRLAVTAGAVLLTSSLAASQVSAYGAFIKDYRYDRLHVALSAVLDESSKDAAPLGKAIRETLASGGAILGSDVTRLAGLVGVPSVSIPPTHFTPRQWDEAAVRELVIRYGVRFILFFPRHFMPEGPMAEDERLADRSRVFFIDIAKGRYPEWVREEHSSENLVLLRVRDAGTTPPGSVP